MSATIIPTAPASAPIPAAVLAGLAPDATYDQRDRARRSALAAVLNADARSAHAHTVSALVAVALIRAGDAKPGADAAALVGTTKSNVSQTLAAVADAEAAGLSPLTSPDGVSIVHAFKAVVSAGKAARAPFVEAVKASGATDTEIVVRMATDAAREARAARAARAAGEGSPAAGEGSPAADKGTATSDLPAATKALLSRVLADAGTLTDDERAAVREDLAAALAAL